MNKFFLYALLLFAAIWQLQCVALDVDTICGSGCKEDDRNYTHIYAAAFCYNKYYQDIFYEQCGASELVGFYKYYCVQTESGKYCTELLEPFATYPRVHSSCRDLQTCTPECQSSLEQLGDELGCCANVLQADNAKCRIANKCHLTVDPISRVTEPEICEQDPYSTHGIPLLSIEKRCTVRPDLRQKVISKLYENSCLKQSAFSEYSSCDRNKDGNYCHQLYTPSELSTIKNVYERCSRRLDTNCTTSCHEALIQAKEQYGCCANSYIYTDIPFHLRICRAKIDLWSHCNVESPGFCSNDFELRGSDAERGSAIGLRYVQSLLLLSLLIAGIKL